MAVTKALSTFLPRRPSISTSGRAIAVILKPLIDLHGEPKNWATAAPLYIDALSDIPPELLHKAVKYAIASNPFFPKPADLRASIVDELSAFRKKEDEAFKASLPKPERTPPPTKEDVEYVGRLLDNTFGALRRRRNVFLDDESDGIPARD